uniref:Large ribosomal subunit protein uL15/eL18 domain-containing protein n=1 Tax=Arcella intermedia TaxID=1963864 RepID=A0A6B2LGF7_9EUKA
MNTLKDIDGAKKRKVRLGRGAATGLGKTSGKGNNGQGQHSKGPRPGFEGGQTPIYRRMRKHGFTNTRFARRWSTVNLGKLQFWIDTGRIDPLKKITIRELITSGCAGKLRKKQVGVKLLGGGSVAALSHPLTVEVSQASTSAIAAIERAGGSVKLVYHDRVGLRSVLHPEKFVGKLPYLRPPRSYKNRKLRRPQVQPDQHVEWMEAHEKVMAQKAQKESQDKEPKEVEL